MKPYISHWEDGSVLIEWVSEEQRFGLSLDASESSWYYVDKDGRAFADLLPADVIRVLDEFEADRPAEMTE